MTHPAWRPSTIQWRYNPSIDVHNGATHDASSVEQAKQCVMEYAARFRGMKTSISHSRQWPSKRQPQFRQIDPRESRVVRTATTQGQIQGRTVRVRRGAPCWGLGHHTRPFFEYRLPLDLNPVFVRPWPWLRFEKVPAKHTVLLRAHPCSHTSPRNLHQLNSWLHPHPAPPLDPPRGTFPPAAAVTELDVRPRGRLPPRGANRIPRPDLVQRRTEAAEPSSYRGCSAVLSSH